MAYCRASVKSFVAGFRDALWPGAFIYVITSPLIRRRFFQCAVLNGIIFIGSICCLNYIIIPLFVFMLKFAGLSSTSTEWAEFTIDKLYKVNLISHLLSSGSCLVCIHLFVTIMHTGDHFHPCTEMITMTEFTQSR